MTLRNPQSTRFWLLVIVCISILVASFTSSGVALYLRFQQTNDKRVEQRLVDSRIRQVAADQRRAIAGILCLARSDLRAPDGTTAKRDRRAEAFYSRALASIGAQRCPRRRP